MKIFEGRATYVPKFPNEEEFTTQEYNYDDALLIVVAVEERDAVEKIKNFLVKENAGTSFECWEMIEIYSASGEQEEKDILKELEFFELMGRKIIGPDSTLSIGVFTGKARYDRERCDGYPKNSPHRFNGVVIGVIARSREDAIIKIKEFLMIHNPKTVLHLWDIENVESAKSEGLTIEENIKMLQHLMPPVEFININLPVEREIEVELIEGEDPDDEGKEG